MSLHSKGTALVHKVFETELSSDLGKKLRQRRRAIGKTLVQVATESNLSVGFISQVERGQSTPSLASLYAISKALETSMESLVRSPAPAGAITRHAQREIYKLGANAVRYEHLGRGFPDAKISAELVHRPPGHKDPRMSHEGEEFVYLMQGTVLYEIDGTEHRLQAHDTIHFQSTKPHCSTNVGAGTSIELWIGTMPIFL